MIFHLRRSAYALLLTLSLHVGFATLARSETTATAESSKPNIVFMMADDLGPGWVDFDGSSPEINTPNLERLARNGMVFSKAYAAATVCSPTRAACITGMSPAQIGLTTHIPGIAGRERPAPKGGPKDAETLNHLPLDLPSYARELKQLGYTTGFLGKWHLAGDGSIKTNDGVVNSDWHPVHYGFDTNIGGCAYGQPKSWFDPYKNGTIEDRKKGEYLTDRLGDEAVSFIKTNQDTPFHLSLWFYSVHTPIKAPRDLVKKNGGNAYLAMLESMDNAIGKVLDTLEATGTLKNTLIVFYSDNGGDKPTKWLADKKGSLLEGGVRVPMAVAWPGAIQPGTSCDTPVTSMDFFPTFVHAAGGSTSDIEQLEGSDLMPLFQGKNKLDRDALYWHYPHNRPDVRYYMGSSILQDGWKLYVSHGVKEDALFNLNADPMERENVLKSNPELADRLRAKLTNWLTKVNAKMPPPLEN
ncbi:sulfatase [Aporhodopirellula aestuarii]|uniref:Sulfatase n=1 Tax=Aporhodopirellula aestuarii TaxID=2950107 RepID=A0ABT0TYC2_9BACT|nr:sulfatase [Aporhodopirellula aestuarii]MCM2369599.1 sulfatase [Aporhodopirellula aestuarii]